MAAAGPSTYWKRLPDTENENAYDDGLDAMEGGGQNDGGQMEGVYDRDEVMGDGARGCGIDEDTNGSILREAAASVRCGAWPQPRVDEYVSDEEEEEDRDTPDADDDWESQPEDSDDEEDVIDGLSAWDALGGNFARELSDVGQYINIPLALLFMLLSFQLQCSRKPQLYRQSNPTVIRPQGQVTHDPKDFRNATVRIPC
jgi:hypothetical protein